MRKYEKYKRSYDPGTTKANTELLIMNNETEGYNSMIVKLQ